ncbi:MAG: hypothetical protein H6667_15235 [Ardenticatenaceae bacterium]|nr:hypothetical protein [Ardenticatenaceae bacterium]MCB9446262.1 hypothetical protein [Ardenticatenaceae bacterium]
MKLKKRLAQFLIGMLMPLAVLAGLYEYVLGEQRPYKSLNIVLPGRDCLADPSHDSEAARKTPWSRYLYNDTYGWFDTSHFNTGHPAQVISDVVTAVQQNGRVITISQGVRDNLTGYSASYWVSGEVDEAEITAVAWSIYVDWSTRFEQWQGEVPRSLAGPFTPFSIEDLPSQYLGFFAAAHRLTYEQVFACYLGGIEIATDDPPHFGFEDDPADPNSLPDLLRLRNETFMPLVETEAGWEHLPWPPAMFMATAVSKPDTWFFIADETWYFDR